MKADSQVFDSKWIFFSSLKVSCLSFRLIRFCPFSPREKLETGQFWSIRLFFYWLQQFWTSYHFSSWIEVKANIFVYELFAIKVFSAFFFIVIAMLLINSFLQRFLLNLFQCMNTSSITLIATHRKYTILIINNKLSLTYSMALT